TDYHQSLKIARFSSCLGFVLDGRLLDDPFVRAAGAFPATGGQIVGVELNEAPAEPLPAEVDFIVCSRDTLPGLERLKLPKLILETSWHDGHVSEPEPASDILGSLFA